MIFRIPYGKHRAKPFRFWFWFRRRTFKWQVTFGENCRYDLGHPDQLDINKLIGIGYLPHHHKESARFGWRYWTGKDQIELLAYCYVNGERIAKHIGYCNLGEPYTIELFANRLMYYFCLVNDMGEDCGVAEVKHNHRKNFKYRLGVWFGGSRPCPGYMEITIKKL